MTGIETVLTEIDAVGRDLNRRTFLKGVAAAFVVPTGPIAEDDERFFRRVTATLVPAIDLRRTGIDPVENLRHLLDEPVRIIASVSVRSSAASAACRSSTAVSRSRCADGRRASC